jgi:hypothetical protein
MSDDRCVEGVQAIWKAQAPHGKTPASYMLHPEGEQAASSVHERPMPSSRAPFRAKGYVFAQVSHGESFLGGSM